MENQVAGLTILAFDAHGFRLVDDPDEIPGLVAQDGTVVWCDVRHPHNGALDLVRDEFDLHPFAIEDATKHGQRPKLNQFDTHAFVVAHYSDLRTCEMVEVDLFLGKHWLITVHETAPGGGVFDVDECRDRILRRVEGELTASFLFYLVLDEIVDTYGPTIEHIVEQVELIEAQIFDSPDPERGQHEVQRLMHRLRRRLLEFRRRVAPAAEVVAGLLREDTSWIDHHTRQYLQDVHDHLVRVADDIDMYRAVVDNTVDAHLALVANHQNDVMKFMTSWGAILIFSTLIAGVYGMNFEHMPELTWQLGYPGALTLMAVCTGLLYRYFKRKDWL